MDQTRTAYNENMTMVKEDMMADTSSMAMNAQDTAQSSTVYDSSMDQSGGMQTSARGGRQFLKENRSILMGAAVTLGVVMLARRGLLGIARDYLKGSRLVAQGNMMGMAEITRGKALQQRAKMRYKAGRNA